MQHIHEQLQVNIPDGARCELCLMTAVYAQKDQQGVAHYYCSHHKPAEKDVAHHAGHVHDDNAMAHDKHAGHSPNMFRDKFWLSLVLTIPVVLYAPMIQTWLRFHMPAFPGSAWLPFVLGTAIFLYGGPVFIASAWTELKFRQPGMMTLISLAIITAFAYSLATTFFITGSEFFWELATLITIMLLGHWMEMRSVQSAQGALNELAKLLPDTAELVLGDDSKTVNVSTLAVKDIVLVRPGSKVPADGIVVKGESSVNESMITGESRSINKTLGSNVIAGTVNGTGVLTVEVRSVGESTALAGIMRLVAEAQTSRSKAQILADRAAFYLTIVAILAGIATLIGWLIAGKGAGYALERTVTVLVIACPHALGLAIPLVASISTTLAARNGLLIKQRLALESARNVDVVLFDKTGTLTKGEQSVVDVWPRNSVDESSLLAAAASVESGSEHMIGKAIVNYAKQKNVRLYSVDTFKAIPGHGVEGSAEGKMLAAGGPQLLELKKITVPEGLRANIEQAEIDGKTVIYIFQDTAIMGVITIADVVREESKEAINALKKLGVRIAMLTGDSQEVAEYVARELGITEIFAQVLPEHKVGKVKELQKDGSSVAMVGDGVNDAPALTQADIGIAIGAGTDVAIESAGIVLIKNDPRDIVKIIKLSQATYRKMIQNLVWATGYNILAIPLAAGVLASFGIILAPAVGALLMSVSTVVVALNAQFLRKLKL